jgi:hypothetical protein
MKFFSYLNGLLGKPFSSTANAQDVNLPLHINFKSRLTFDSNPFVSAITHGALLDVPLDNLKFLPITAISSIRIQGMDDKKIHRFYFKNDNTAKRMFLQTLSAIDNPQQIAEILFCCSVTEPPESEEDIEFFLGENDSGLGEAIYSFSRDDLSFFLPEQECSKRFAADCEFIEYSRVDDSMEFMPAFSGVETVIFDPQGTTGQSVRIMNFMPHSRALSDTRFEELIIAFWVITSENGQQVVTEEQIPLVEYLFAIKLEPTNITVI